MTIRTHLLTPLILGGLFLPSLSQANLDYLQGPGKPANEQAAQEKDIDALVKDAKKIDGIFTLYRTKNGTADTIYMEVPESALGRYAIIQATASTGIANNGALAFHGQPLNDIAFKMKQVDDGRVLFVQPDLDYRSPTSAEGQRAIDRAIPSNITYSFDVKARSKDRKSLLIDVSQFFKSDFAQISGNPALFSIDPGNTYIDSIKNFPENMVVRTMYRLSQRPASPFESPRSIPFAVSYNLSLLPVDNGYQPRLADTRIGFFGTGYQDLSEAMVTQQNVNYIQRWDLRKKDPNAAVSDPVKPIVFWIDNAVPPRFRQAVREGIEMWNPVFEKEVGISHAIVVNQMPDDADWDIADIRYNVIRWTQNLPFAISLFRANPLTGEILNSGINMDVVFATDGANEYDFVYGPAGNKPVDPLAGNMFLDRYQGTRCFVGQERQSSMSMARSIIDAIDSQADAAAEREKIAYQAVRETVGHEMGHSLGLRHNFISSGARTPAELADPIVSQTRGINSSIMEYMPYNIYAIKHPGVDYFTRMPGEYDHWAIRYGYMPPTASTPQGELPALKALASQDGAPGMDYETDQMTNSSDPYVYTFDLSSDPLNWMQKEYDTAKYLFSTLGDRTPKNGESYWTFSRAFNRFLTVPIGRAGNAVRFIGGVHVKKNFKGDPNEKPMITAVDAATQRRALAFMIKGIFSEDSISIPKSYLAKLTTDPDTFGTQGDSVARSAQVFSGLAVREKLAVNSVFDPARLTRVANNEFRVSNKNDTLSMAELYRTTGAAIWSELGDGHEISMLRRDLQRAHLALLIKAVLNRPAGLPEDAVTLSYEQLRWLEGATARAMKTAKGEYGMAHLAECNMRIRQALTAVPERHEG